MSRFVFITLLASLAIKSAEPYVVGYGPGYYLRPLDYPYSSYPYTPVTYVETIPIISGPPPVETVPVLPAKLVAKNARQKVAPLPVRPSARQELPQVPAVPFPPPPRAPSGRLELPRPSAQVYPPPPPAPSARQELPMPSDPAPPPPPAPPAPPAMPPQMAPPKSISITASFPDFDPAQILSALPINQLLELPPVKAVVELKKNKLEAVMGLKNALQGKLATLAALLP